MRSPPTPIPTHLVSISAATLPTPPMPTTATCTRHAITLSLPSRSGHTTHGGANHTWCLTTSSSDGTSKESGKLQAQEVEASTQVLDGHAHAQQCSLISGNEHPTVCVLAVHELTAGPCHTLHTLWLLVVEGWHCEPAPCQIRKCAKVVSSWGWHTTNCQLTAVHVRAHGSLV